MTTKTEPKSKPAKKASPATSKLRQEAAKGPNETERALISWIVENDARLFCESKRQENPLTIDDAFRQAADAVASVGPISRTWFDAVVDGNCRFFRQPLKLFSTSEHVAFTSAEWDELEKHCRTLRSDLERLKLQQCAILLRTRMRTNARQLLGLPKPLHVWTDAANWTDYVK